MHEDVYVINIRIQPLQIEEFVNKYITCARIPAIKDLHELVKLQVHRHSQSCKKNNKPVCRFNFQVPPMIETKMLEPLLCPTEEENKEHADNWKQIKANLEKLDADTELTFQKFLDSLHINEDD